MSDKKSAKPQHIPLEGTTVRWKDRIAQHTLDAPMLNRLTRVAREELWDVMQEHLMQQMSAQEYAQLEEDTMLEHCQRFSQLLLECLHDGTKRDPNPGSWQELEARIDEARHVRLPQRLKEARIDLDNELALRTIQELFSQVAESALNRAKFDREKPPEGAYLQ